MKPRLPPLLRSPVFWLLLGIFVIVYGVVFTAGIRLINKLINKGPLDLPRHAPTTLGANRPLTGAVARTGAEP